MGSRLPDIPIFQPIGELETFTKGDSIYFTPARNYPLVDYSGSDDLISNFPQRIEFALSIVQGVQDAVRNRLLDWSIKLEQQGILGENMSFKEEEKAIAKNQTFNISGDFSRVNFQSRDSSVNIQHRTETVFETARQALRDGIEDHVLLNDLLARLQAVEEAKSRPAWAAAYGKFVECAANHMTIIAPLLPLLAETAKNAF